MAAVQGSGLALGEFGNDNTSGGLASFLHDNLLLSDVNLVKQGGGGAPVHGEAINSQQSVGDFLKKGSIGSQKHAGGVFVGHSPIKPFSSLHQPPK